MLDSVVEALLADKSRKFIFVEMVFLDSCSVIILLRFSLVQSSVFEVNLWLLFLFFLFLGILDWILDVRHRHSLSDGGDSRAIRRRSW